VILVLGFILRFYQLDHQPAAMLDYEGTTGLSGIEIMEGNHDYHILLWSFIARPIMNTYSSPFFAFPLALFFRIFGISIITLRSLSALFGTITIAAIYGLVRARGSRLLALLSAFFMAISTWHIVISRVGLALSLTPLYAIVIGWILLKAFESQRWRYFFLSGIGLGCYWLFYMVGKIMIPVTMALILHQIILTKDFIKRHWSGLTIFILVVLLVSILSGLGPGEWLLGAGKQARNFIWQREGPDSSYTNEINYHWAGRYLIENIQKSFRYLFLRSHHEFLLPSKLPFINPLLFPFFVIGFFYSLFRWKKDLNFFFVVLFLTAFIPQIIFATFQDKASLRHLMLMIPSLSYFTALPFYFLTRGLMRNERISSRITAGIVIFPLLISFLAGSFYIIFLSPHWNYLVCRMRREGGEFVRDHLNQYYFFVVRGKFPLYLQNRIIDFITYPEVQALHYHVPKDYPQSGGGGEGISEKYAYIQAEELPDIFSRLGSEIPRAGFVFEQKELVPVFEEKFGAGSVRQQSLESAPWVYYTVLYPTVP
jgi:4-amino-4-deoxy-L-arabinose transferase-like glycosyltransferase